MTCVTVGPSLSYCSDLGLLCLDRGVVGSVWVLFLVLPVSFVLLFVCLPVLIGYVIDGEDHMFGKCDVYLLGTSVLGIIWRYGLCTLLFG